MNIGVSWALDSHESLREERAKKKRDIRRDYRAAGFDERQDKGDHTIFTHLLLPGNYAVDGVEGKDAKRYDEKPLPKPHVFSLA